MENKKIFKRIVAVNNTPEKIFNNKQTFNLMCVYLILSVSLVKVLNWIGSLLVKELSLPIYISGFILAFIIIVIMGVKFNLSKRFPDKYAYLDNLLTQYKSNNQEAYDHLKKETAENPYVFPDYLDFWIKVEKQTYDEYKIKPKYYQFTNSKK